MGYEYITKHDSPNYTPNARVKSRYGVPRTIDGIVVHWWGDPAKKPAFDGIIGHLCRVGGNTSAHEVIEAGRVAVLVNHKDAAWHAGNGRANATKIGLELNPRCSDEDYATAAERIADIWHGYNKILPLSPHNEYRNTQCPGSYVLDRLHREALAFYNGAPTPPSPPTPPAPTMPPVVAPAPPSNVRVLRLGSTGDLVGKLQSTLRSRYPLYAKHLKVDNSYGPATQAVVREYQRRAGLTVDGVAGPITLASLGI